MTNLTRRLILAVALMTGITPAVGQVPSFPLTMPSDTFVGRIQPGSGPSSAVPISALLARVVPLAGLPNSSLNKMPAATIKGNPTGSTAFVQDFTLQGLVNRNTPDANNDKLLIFDNATGTFKYVLPGAIAAAATSGVSTFGGMTGGLACADVINCTGGTVSTIFTQTGTGAVATTLSSYLQMVITPEQFGAAGDCTTDDQTAITKAIAAAVSQIKQLLFSRACYAHSGTLAFGFNNLEVRFVGFVTIKVLSSYSGNNVSIDAGPASNQLLHGVQFGRGNPPYLTGHVNTARNLFVRGVVQSWIEARGGDASPGGTGFEVNYAVGTTFRFIYDANGGTVPLLTSKPGNAILFAIRNAGETVTACDIFAIADSLTVGVLFTGVSASTIRGFSESNSGTGTYLLNATNNTFIDWFSESNGTHGILIDTGSGDNRFIGGTAGGAGGVDLTLLSGSFRNQFKGGQYIVFTDGGTNNNLEEVGAFTFSPNASTTWQRVYNGSAVFYPDRPNAPAAFATLAACSVTYQGAIAEVFDSTTSTYGATITGGGANKVKARCNTVNWIVD